MITSNSLHPSKTPSPIEATFSGIVIDDNNSQFEKADLPIDSILLGRVIDADNLPNANEKLLILRIEQGN